MILKQLSIINYRNIAETQLELSPKINCLIGSNGEGKTNFLDAIFFLSFCKSYANHIDSQLIRHDEAFFMLDAKYLSDSGDDELIYCGLKRGSKKIVRHNKKAYKKLSEHIGLIPLIIVSPNDISLIEGGSEERRKLMDVVISQYDNSYIESLSAYNKALMQRNSLLKMEEEPDPLLIDFLEKEMGRYGEIIYKKRNNFVEQLSPMFNDLYNRISSNGEKASLQYVSHCQRGDLYEVIKRDRAKDRIMGYSLHGIHRDDLELQLNGYPMKKEGSQGQNKTFVVALKLAQFEFLAKRNVFGNDKSIRNEKPILLLDDIFDKLDANRVEQIIHIVSSDNFGQIFITDTNRDHLDLILQTSSADYKLFYVENGCISMKEERNV